MYKDAMMTSRIFWSTGIRKFNNDFDNYNLRSFSVQICLTQNLGEK